MKQRLFMAGAILSLVSAAAYAQTGFAGSGSPIHRRPQLKAAVAGAGAAAARVKPVST